MTISTKSEAIPKLYSRVGAAILGPGGDEAIHSILDIMYAKAPYTVIQRAVHIHPTVSELIPTMLGELNPTSVNDALSAVADSHS